MSQNINLTDYKTKSPLSNILNSPDSGFTRLKNQLKKQMGEHYSSINWSFIGTHTSFINNSQKEAERVFLKKLISYPKAYNRILNGVARIENLDFGSFYENKIDPKGYFRLEFLNGRLSIIKRPSAKEKIIKLISDNLSIKTLGEGINTETSIKITAIPFHQLKKMIRVVKSV